LPRQKAPPRGEASRRRSVGVFFAALLAGCTQEPVNSPYALGELQENTLYTAFAESSPKTLDPAGSYSADETPFTYSIYEPLFRYAYLARPYRLEAGTAVSLVEPRYYDAQGGELPEDAPGDEVAVSVYDIAIKPGIRFQPHPAFAQRGDGSYVYWPIKPEQLGKLEQIADFHEDRKSTR